MGVSVGVGVGVRSCTCVCVCMSEKEIKTPRGKPFSFIAAVKNAQNQDKEKLRRPLSFTSSASQI